MRHNCELVQFHTITKEQHEDCFGICSTAVYGESQIKETFRLKIFFLNSILFDLTTTSLNENYLVTCWLFLIMGAIAAQPCNDSHHGHWWILEVRNSFNSTF